MKKIFKGKEKVVTSFGIAIVTIITIICSICFNRKKQSKVADVDIETKMARSYQQLTDEQMSVNNGTVKFGAYFLKDIDGDGYNERLLGTCKSVGESDTLVLDINVLGDGTLQDGVIKIESTNFKYKMTELEDTVLSGNYVSDNVREIVLKELPAGTQRLVMGTILSNIIEPADYSKNTQITLQGTYVCKGQEDVPINKSIDVTVDWYGTATSNISYVSKKKYDYASYNKLDSINKELSFNFKLKRAEDKNSLLVKAHYVDVEIPKLKNEYPISVTCSEQSYSYNEETHILSINKETSSIEESYRVTLVYPDTVYEQIMNDNKNGIVDEIYPVIRGHLECFNNGNLNLKNPYITNTSVATATIQIGNRGSAKAGHIAKVSIKGKEYIKRPYKQEVISKQELIDAYNSEDPVENKSYTILWSVYRDTVDIDNSTIEFEDMGDKLNNTIVDSESYINSVGIYFGATGLIPSSGTISVFNKDTDECIVEFKDGEWKKYNSDNPYYYDDEVKNIIVRTSEEARATATLEIYNIKEIDINKLKEHYTDRKAIEDLEELSTRVKMSGSKISNEVFGTDAVNFICEKSYAGLEISPDVMRTSEIEPVPEKIKIELSEDDVEDNTWYSKWQNGIFVIEIPSKIIDVSIENVTSSENIEVVNSVVLNKNGKRFIKVITKNDEPVKCFEINLDTKMQVNPMLSNSAEQIKLYTYNEFCNMYYGSTEDVYDINGNNNNTEIVGSNTAKLIIDAADGFITTETVTNYSNEADDEITIAPNVAEVKQSTRQATVNVQFMNNYTQKASNVQILGRAPFEGNTYMNGQTLHSAFTANMADSGIIVPDEIKDKVTIYYSEKGTATKDLTDTNNGWVRSENITDLSNIKSYLIIIDGDIQRAKAYTFSYNVVIPEGISPNLATFCSHMVYYDLTINDALTSLYVQPRKVGIRIAKYYGMEITKYKEGTEHPVEGATYQLIGLDEEGKEEVRETVSTSDGKLILNDVRVNQIYTFKELCAPKNYSLSDKEIKFRVIEKENALEYELLPQTDSDGNKIGQANFEGEVTLNELNGNYTLKSCLYDTPKYQLTINKKDGETHEKLSNIKFVINGKSYISNREGQVVTDNLELNKQYILHEIKPEGYYALDDIKFTVVKDKDGELKFTCDNSAIGDIDITNNVDEDLVKVNISLTNDKIPTYNLKVIKVEENKKINDLKKLKKLKGAEFILYSEDSEKEEIYETDENGEINLTNLYQYVAEKEDKISARYMLKEKRAPRGYINSEETIHFRAEQNSEGVIELKIEDSENKTTVKNVAVDGETITLALQNKPLFHITKVDSETKKPLANAGFTIIEVNEDGSFKNYAQDIYGSTVGTLNDNNEYIVRTDESGELSLPLKDGKYEMMEVEFPTGYDKHDNVERFEIVTNAEEDEPDPEPDSEPDLDIEQPEVVREINTIDKLVEFSNSVNTGTSYEGQTVKLTDDLDFLNEASYENKELMEQIKSQGFSSIGTYVDGYKTFKGTFDGNNHKIDNLNRSLFGYVEHATIKDLAVSGTVDDRAGLIREIYNNKATEESTTIINNCGFSGTIDKNGNTGGIVGNIINSQVSIKDCYNLGTISNGTYTGGIIGYTQLANLTIEGCRNEGSLNAGYAGGIIGGAYGSYMLNIKNCYNTKTLTGKSMTGGIIAYDASNAQELVEDCYNIGKIEGSGYVGGIIGQGYSYKATIRRCHNEGEISAASEYTGGIVGKVEQSTNIDDCYNTGKIEITAPTSSSKRYYVGGIVGYGSDLYIKKCYNKGMFSVTNGNMMYAGGILGYVNNNTSIEECYNDASIYATCEDFYIGGISGRSNNERDLKVSKSYNLGELHGDGKAAYIGGITGYSGTVEESYNKGNIIATNLTKSSQIAGIVASSGDISNCYNEGNIDVDVTGSSGTTYVSGIITFGRYYKLLL